MNNSNINEAKKFKVWYHYLKQVFCMKGELDILDKEDLIKFV